VYIKWEHRVRRNANKQRIISELIKVEYGTNSKMEVYIPGVKDGQFHTTMQN